MNGAPLLRAFVHEIPGVEFPRARFVDGTDSALLSTMQFRIQSALRALRANLVARSPDVVELWKLSVLARLERLSSLSSADGAATTAPLVPFRPAIQGPHQVPARVRLARALTSAGLALAAIGVVLSLPRSPLVVFALVLVALSATRAARETLMERLDVRSGVSSRCKAASAALDAGNHEQAILLARSALGEARSIDSKRRLWSVLAWAGIGVRDPFLAHLALQKLPEADIDLHLLSSYLTCCNRSLEALHLLLAARQLGYRSTETSKHLIELVFDAGDRDQALALARSDAPFLSAEDRRALAAALEQSAASAADCASAVDVRG